MQATDVSVNMHDLTGRVMERIRSKIIDHCKTYDNSIDAKIIVVGPRCSGVSSVAALLCASLVKFYEETVSLIGIDPVSKDPYLYPTSDRFGHLWLPSTSYVKRVIPPMLVFSSPKEVEERFSDIIEREKIGLFIDHQPLESIDSVKRLWDKSRGISVFASSYFPTRCGTERMVNYLGADVIVYVSHFMNGMHNLDNVSFVLYTRELEPFLEIKIRDISDMIDEVVRRDTIKLLHQYYWTIDREQEPYEPKFMIDLVIASKKVEVPELKERCVMLAGCEL